MHLGFCKISVSLFVLAAALASISPAIGLDAKPNPFARMQTSDYTSQPVGHYNFCQRYPAACGKNSGSMAPLKITKDNWKLLVRVNAFVNKKVQAVTDWELYQREEYWEYPNKTGKVWYGDCEDYVLMKQKLLQKHGISPANLLITVVQKPNGEAHAVLTVRTTHGDIVLDNLQDPILNWHDTDYTYLKRQSIKYAGSWVGIKTQQPKQLYAQNMHISKNPQNQTGSLSAIRSISK